MATNFNYFLDLQSKNSGWSKFFDDKGEGVAPLDYMIGIERGLREYRTDKYCLGEKPLRTRERWVNIPIWRKCEAYITLIRYIRRKFTYTKWHDFRHADLMERQELHQTYMNRHAHIWDSGDPFNGRLQHPWDTNSPTPNSPPKKKPKTVSTKVKKPKQPSPPAKLLKFNKDGSFSEYQDLTNS